MVLFYRLVIKPHLQQISSFDLCWNVKNTSTFSSEIIV
jgi:hypothetical protein